MKWNNLKKWSSVTLTQMLTICVTLNAKFPLCVSSIFGYNARRKFWLRDLACGKIRGITSRGITMHTIHILAIKADKQWGILHKSAGDNRGNWMSDVKKFIVDIRFRVNCRLRVSEKYDTLYQERFYIYNNYLIRIYYQEPRPFLSQMYLY